jgi:uncharacterized protein involved in response to NO
VPPAASTHALGAGAIGIMTLAVMVRATHGHTGRELKAGALIKLIFACVLVSALTRIAHALGAPSPDVTLHIAAFAWAFGFIGFAVYHAPMLLRRRATAS